MQIIKTDKIEDVKKVILEHLESLYSEHEIYELSGHGFPEAEKRGEFHAIIKLGKRKKQIEIRYKYLHPSNFFQDEWIYKIINLKVVE
jgi:hypothetical protein